MRSDLLHVVAVVSNPVRYHSRYRLYHNFKNHMRESGVHLTTVELAFGDRPWEVTHPENPDHLQLRTNCEIWHKENMINLGIQHLTRMRPDWRYVAWIDADVRFLRDDWAAETVHALQHYAIVQPWTRGIDMGPTGEPFATSKSFISCYLEKLRMTADPNCPYGPYGYWHSGYAWAARRDAIEKIGLLIDYAILGSADFYMAWSLINKLSGNLYNDVDSLPARKKGFTKAYMDMLFGWQARAQVLQANLGVVEGTLMHYWHGKKKQRQYNTRENILIFNDYDPHLDLYRDSQGLWNLTNRNPKLRDDIRFYFRQRNEDSIDL